MIHIVYCFQGDDGSRKLSGVAEVRTSVGYLRVRAISLPPCVVSLLESNSELLRTISKQSSLSHSTHQWHSDQQEDFSDDHNNVEQIKDSYSSKKKLSEEAINAIENFKIKLKSAFQNVNLDNELYSNIWSFGPSFNGPNLLINCMKNYHRPSVWNYESNVDSFFTGSNDYARYDANLISAFQMATAAGPLCEEPMMGVAFLVEEMQLNTSQYLTSKLPFQVSIYFKLIIFLKERSKL